VKRLQIDTLEKGWAEWDELMLHAAFQCLVDAIEKDRIDRRGWSSDKEGRRIWKEIKTLYDWWKARPNRVIEDDPIEEKAEKEDQKYFHRLIEIRFYLWI